MAASLGWLLLLANVAGGRGTAFPAECVCLESGWTVSGPSAACMSHLATVCASDPQAAPCTVGESEFNGVVLAHISYYASLSAKCSSVAPFLPIFSAEAWTQGMTKHPLYWTPEAVGVMMFFVGESMLGVKVRSTPNAASLLYAADVSGPIFVHVTSLELQAIGLSVGSSLAFTAGRGTWLESFSWPPSDTLSESFGRVVGDQFNVSVAFMLEKLLSLDEANFEFELEMMIVASWKDPKIFTRCTNAGVGGFADSDPCGLFWQPTFVWPTVKLDPGESRIEPSTIEDFGLTTIVGALPGPNGVGDLASRVANHSIGMRIWRVRGTFMGAYHFQKFPYDVQQLNVTVQMPFDLSLRKAKLVAQAEPAPVVEGGGELPLWKVTCVKASEAVKDYTSVGGNWMNSDDPFATFYRQLAHLSLPDMVYEILPPGDTTMSPDAQRYSAAVITIHVTRLHTFYYYNFVIVVMLLVVVSFFSLMFSPAALDARLGLTLTVVLGLNVFQIVIIDNMPVTGYLTSMHNYTILSTILVVAVAVENLVVHLADRRYTAMLTVLARFHELTSSPRARNSAEVIQGRVRRFLRILRRQQELRGATPVLPFSAAHAQVMPAAAGGAEKPGPGEEKPAPAPARADSRARGRKHRRPPGWRRGLRCCSRACSRLVDKLAVFCALYLDRIASFAFPVGFAAMYFVVLGVDSRPQSTPGMGATTC